MGKEWYWGSSGSSKSSNSKKLVAEKGCTTTTTTGCMSVVFQLFDFHHFQFPLNQHHHHPPPLKPTKSFLLQDHHNEAPRNSLELEEPPLSSHSTILNLNKAEENLNIPMGIQIKTRPSSSSCSEISSSPGAKTPNLVARLMGLDLLPNDQTRSPAFSSSSSSCHETPNSSLHHHFRTRQQQHHYQHGKLISHRRSLDVDITTAPRISSARRSDVDHHHRLSLQINRKNFSLGEELEFSRSVKQVKENVSRKFGLEITNTLRNRSEEQARERDELVSQFKAKKNSRVLKKVVDQSSPGKHSTPSCSPRLSRFLEPKQKITTPNTSTKDNNVIQTLPVKFLSSKSKLQPVQEQRPAKKCKKSTGEKFSSRWLKKPPQTTDIIRNKFVRLSAANNIANCPEKKCKQTPLSNDLLNITVPTLLPVKKDLSPSATKLSQKQEISARSSKRGSQLSSNTSQAYKQEATRTSVARNNINEIPNVDTTTAAAAGEFEYLTRILKLMGINKDTEVPFTKWFSPSHPLDPFIFHQLENANPIIMSGELPRRSNRKLMFELVDEILVDILKPCTKMKPWVSSCSSEIIGRDHYGHVQGSALIDMLCQKIRSYPCKDCRVLEDVDGLIDNDLKQMKMQKRIAFEEEGEGVVMEVGKDILDTLMHEIAVEFGIGKYWR